MAERFDPRFDPAFQPGFESSKDDAPPRLRAERPVAEPVAAPIAPAQAEPANPSEDVEDPAAEGNPFERTLWIVAALLVIGGAAITFWANSVNVYYTTPQVEVPWELIVRQSAWSLSQPMITAGLGTAVALLFRRAAAWKSAE